MPKPVLARPLVLVPAIDLRNGCCVRLAQGDLNRETVYSENPVTQAQAFVRAGARRIHVVDLDGAFGAGENAAALQAICRAVDVPVQTGGGVRTAEDVQRRIEAGASFVIIGTLLVEEPTIAESLVERYGSRIIAGIDARAGRVATRGWAEDGGRDRDGLIAEIIGWGVERIIFTEIARDGMGSGYDLGALAQVAAIGNVRITASGGAHSLESLRALAQATPVNVDHAIVGRALYEGTIDLAEAVAACGA